MAREQRQQVKVVLPEIENWSRRARAVQQQRQAILNEAQQATAYLATRWMPLSNGGSPDWNVLHLSPRDDVAVTAIARGNALTPLAEPMTRGLMQLANDAAMAISDAKKVHGVKGIFASRTQKEAAQRAEAYLLNLPQTVLTNSLTLEIANNEAELNRVSGLTATVPAILSPAVGFAEGASKTMKLLPRQQIEAPARSLATLDNALHQDELHRQAVTKAADAVRDAEARKLVAEMPLERLKDATSGRISIKPLTDAGVTNIQQLIDYGTRIVNLPGIGQVTANKMIGAARTIWQTTFDDMPVRIDLKNRPKPTTKLLATMFVWDGSRALRTDTESIEAANLLRPLLRSLPPEATHTIILPRGHRVTDLTDASSRVIERAKSLDTTNIYPGDVWRDFQERPADYYAMLSELGYMAEDEKSQGDLPDEIVEAIRELKLDTTHLNASLRGYQAFGAKFALVQSKVIIGDEMGLGKTVESLAVFTHLKAKGHTHFLVVCPASVVTNWVREVRSKSKLRAHRLHGTGRDAAFTSWERGGGVAVTTYETQAWLADKMQGKFNADCVVFDEAHYLKNPNAQRSQRAHHRITQTERAILLTGTPLENRLDEFRALVGYLRPDLTVSASEFAPVQFRKQVAPAYLRRNQEDVLTELPELIEVDEWVSMSYDDYQHYCQTVMEGNFMAMRQAAFRSGSDSQKMQRLLDIVEEAKASGRRVIVFSYFKDVLAKVAAALPGHVFGPLSGEVPAQVRQQMVDDFSTAPHGAVLVSQIVAGGVGLNIQAASVIIICEPQLKPTTEWQAIARAHRMGQLDSVQVHRLLTEEGVDRRITEILASKSALFAEFARQSEMADVAPEAFDISDAEIARKVVAEERERIMGQGN